MQLENFPTTCTDAKERYNEASPWHGFSPETWREWYEYQHSAASPSPIVAPRTEKIVDRPLGYEEIKPRNARTLGVSCRKISGEKAAHSFRKNAKQYT